MYSVVIVLYNCEVSDSQTIASLLNHWSNKKDLHLDIINNGPSLIDEVPLGIKGTFKYFQYLENRRLSSLYNEFLERNESEYYVILDDDSVLTEKYFESLESLKKQSPYADFALPKILSDGKCVYPKKIDRNSKQISNRDGVMSISSGLVIRQRLVLQYIKQYGKVFDERFYLYGVDSSFFDRLLSLDQEVFGCYAGNIVHSLSSNEEEAQIVRAFRSLERSNDFALSTRYYFNVHKCIRLVYFIFTNPLGIGKFKLLSFHEVLKTMLSGIHYRER